LVDAIRHAVPAPKDPHDATSAGSGLTGNLFRELQQRIREAAQSAGQPALEDIDGIDNLALLTGRENSALNNSIFEVKRKAIIDLDRAGAYIPVCTRNVFLKYYTDAAAQQIHFWGPADRRGYAAAMAAMLDRYLLPEEPNG
jgi:hypothetical protein